MTMMLQAVTTKATATPLPLHCNLGTTTSASSTGQPMAPSRGTGRDLLSTACDSYSASYSIRANRMYHTTSMIPWYPYSNNLYPVSPSMASSMVVAVAFLTSSLKDWLESIWWCVASRCRGVKVLVLPRDVDVFKGSGPATSSKPLPIGYCPAILLTSAFVPPWAMLLAQPKKTCPLFFGEATVWLHMSVSRSYSMLHTYLTQTFWLNDCN